MTVRGPSFVESDLNRTYFWGLAKEIWGGGEIKAKMVAMESSITADLQTATRSQAHC